MAGLFAYVFFVLSGPAFVLRPLVRIVSSTFVIGERSDIVGTFGSAFVTLMPVLLSVSVRFLDRNLNLHIAESTISNLELMVFGGLIIFFLIVEPHGLARLWQIGKEAAAVAVPALGGILSLPAPRSGTMQAALDRGSRWQARRSNLDSSGGAP